MGIRFLEYLNGLLRKTSSLLIGLGSIPYTDPEYLKNKNIQEMKNLIFLALGLFCGKYPAENIHAVNWTVYQTFSFIG